MERIAPLAKILAEANGIDWQKLRGTGEGGMIVEQDILNYLSRIMSGEEEPPATPVDAPPADWTGMDMAPSAAMLKGAGVDSDIAAFVEQSRTAPPSLNVTPPASGLDTEALEFELDDEDDAVPASAPSIPTIPSAAAPAAPAAPAVTPPSSWDWSAPIAPVTPSVPEVASPSFTLPDLTPPSLPEFSAPSAAMPDVRTSSFSLPDLTPPTALPEVPPVVPPAQVAGAGVAAAGLGSLLSQLYHKEAAPAPANAESQESHAAQPEPVVPAVSAPEFAAPEMTAPEFAAPEFTAPAVSAPQVHAPEVHTPEVHVPDFQMPEVAAPAQQAEGTHHEPEPVAPTIPAFTEPAPADQHTAPVAEDVTEQVAGEVHAAPQAEVAHAEPVHPEPVHPEPVHPEPVHEESHAAVAAAPVPTPAPVVAESAAPAASAPAGAAVWFGTYLRRDANLGPASDLRGQLVGALGRDVPLVFLVARAAERHADALGLHSVALHDHRAGHARPVERSHLRDALSALDSSHEGTPDLLVVDAGELDLDDLHYPHTATLSVGRLHDGHAALTLNGNLDAAKAAQFLTTLVQTLDQPIALVL